MTARLDEILTDGAIRICTLRHPDLLLLYGAPDKLVVRGEVVHSGRRSDRIAGIDRDELLLVATWQQEQSSRPAYAHAKCC
jgi:hypothetical protein